MIVDTSFVLDVIDDVEAAVRKEQELEAGSIPLVIPSMAVLELYIGVGKVANTREERQMVNRLGVKPRGFPWISRTRLGYHWDDALSRYPRSRSGRPRPPMPAVAPSALGEGC